jgi:hypothetical protein
VGDDESTNSEYSEDIGEPSGTRNQWEWDPIMANKRPSAVAVTRNSFSPEQRAAASMHCDPASRARGLTRCVQRERQDAREAQLERRRATCAGRIPQASPLHASSDRTYVIQML